MSIVVPANIWHTISAFTDPNPFSYLRLSLVCRSAAQVFSSDKLWRSVAPYNVENHFEEAFKEEANTLDNRQKKLLVGLWDDIEMVKAKNHRSHQFLARHCDKFDSVGEEAVKSRTLALPWAVWSGTAMESAMEATPKGGILRKLPFWADEAFVACCISACPFLLNFADKSLKSSPHVILAALRRDKMAILWATPELRDEKSFVLKATRTNPQVLRYISPELQKSPEVALAAVQADGAALQQLHGFQNDPRIVVAAIRNDPHALKYASLQLQGDRFIVFEAVKRDPWTFNYASKELKNDRELVLEVVMREGDLLRVVSHFQDDRELVQAAVEADGAALQYACKELRDDRDIVEAAVETDPEALKYASQELRDDREIVEAAVDADPEALRYASQTLQRDEEMLEHKKDAENRPRAPSIAGAQLARKSSMIANSTTSLATMAGLKGMASLAQLTGSKTASSSTPDIPQWKKTYTTG